MEFYYSLGQTDLTRYIAHAFQQKKKKKAYSSQAKLCRINHILAHKQVLIKLRRSKSY